MNFLARNSRNLNASCAGALSCWRIHLSGQSSGLFFRTDSRNLVSTSNFVTMLIHRLPLCNKIVVDYPIVVEQTHKHGLELRARYACFFGRGEFCVFHCMLWRFLSGSYCKHHVSSHVMILSNISALCKRSDEMWSRRFFWASVKIRGTIFAEMFLIPKSSVIICRTVFLLYLVLLLFVSRLIFDLSVPRFVLCPHSHLSFVFLAAHLVGHLAHFLALPSTAYAIQKHSISL
jgi:hypothetical protein